MKRRVKITEGPWTPHGFSNSKKVCVIAAIKDETAAFVRGTVSDGVLVCACVCVCAVSARLAGWLTDYWLTAVSGFNKRFNKI